MTSSHIVTGPLGYIEGGMTNRCDDKRAGHVLILGYGEVTTTIVNEVPGEVESLVVTNDNEGVAVLRNQRIDVLPRDPSDEDHLLRAGIEHARTVLVASDNDQADALTVRTARTLNLNVPIVAGATNREQIELLQRAGADTVISPVKEGAGLLVDAALSHADGGAG